MNERIYICVASNIKYSHYLYVMLTSLFEKNRENDIYVYILEREFDELTKNVFFSLSAYYEQNIEFIHVDGKTLSDFPVSKKLSIEAYFRLLIPLLIPQTISKLIYLDVDVLIRDSLYELYNIDMGSALFLACIDSGMPQLDDRRISLYKRTDDLRYFNSGVMVWNLHQIRNEYQFDAYYEAAEELGYDMPYADQDILNYMMYDKVKYIDSCKYNYMVKGMEYAISDPVIVHFANVSPWSTPSRNIYYKEWWNYAKNTPFYQSILEDLLYNSAERYFESEFKQQKEIRDIAEMLLDLKATGYIEEHINSSDYNYYLYGAGHIADIFIRNVDLNSIAIKLKGIVDKYKTGYFYGIEILKIQDLIESKACGVIIVTPTVGKDELIDELKMIVAKSFEIISMKEFLRNIRNLYKII